MSQVLKEKLTLISSWMQETENTVSSQDSFNPDALQPNEVLEIYEMFSEVLSVELRKKQLALMIKSTKLLMLVTGNLLSARDKLSSLLEALLTNIISLINYTEAPEEIKKLLVNEFLIIFEECMADAGAVDHMMRDFSPKILAIVGNANIEFFVRTDLLKSLNKFLIKVPIEVRKAVYDLNGQEFESLVDCLYNCGDYDMQATIIETLLRYTTRSVRHKMASAWFPNYVKLQSLFLGIKDFESDCRTFLGHFNEGLSDKKQVWSYPMMFCTVEGRSLVKPEDLAEFWVDFNFGPGTVSFYYVFKEDGNQGWQLFTLSKAQTKKIQTRFEQGRWKVSISCSNEGKADIVLEFNQPRDIPSLLKTMFPSLHIEEQLQKAPKQSISGKSLLFDTKKARPSMTPATVTKATVKKIVKAKARKSSISGHLKAYDCSASEGLSSDMPAAQPRDDQGPQASTVSPPSQKINKGSMIKKLAKASLSKSFSFLKKSRLTRAGGRVPGDSSSQDSMNGNGTMPLKGKVIKRKTPVAKLRSSKNSSPDARTSAKAGNTSSEMATKKPEVVAKDMEDEAVAGESESSSGHHGSDSKKHAKVLKKTDSSGVKVMTSPRPRSVSPIKAVSRLSYSGRRARAQRTALKRKSEEVSFVVKKKLCFDQDQDVEKLPKDKDPVESDINPAEAPMDYQEATATGDNLEPVDMDITKPEDVSKSEEPAKNVSKFEEPTKDISKSEGPVKTTSKVEEIVQDAEFDYMMIGNVADPSTQQQASKNNHSSDITEKNDDDSFDKAGASKRVRTVESRGKGRDAKSKKSDKVLFSESMMEECEAEARIPDATEDSLLAAAKVPTFDDIYKKPKVLASRKSIVQRKSPRKLKDQEPSPVKLTRASSKKFFKTKSQDLSSDKVKIAATTEKKRPYQKKTTPKSKASPVADPYSIWSPSPKTKRGPPRASYGQSRKRRTAGSKRRSEKLFSDESDKESVGLQRAISKSLPDYVFFNKDAGGDSANASLNINTIVTSKTPSSLKKRNPNNVSKSTLKCLEHVVGVLDCFADQVDGVSKIVLKDICFFITEKSDALILNQ